MQFNPKEYSPADHDRYKALSVMQPYANGIKTGEKYIELRGNDTKYRGDILICATARPLIKDLSTACSIVIVELYDTKKVSELSPAEIKGTMADFNVLEHYKDGYGWMLRNPRPVIEFPVKGQLGIYNLVYSKDCIMPYPRRIVLEREEPKTEEKPKGSWAKFKDRIRPGKP